MEIITTVKIILSHLERSSLEIKIADLTVKPSKVDIAFMVTFLGHNILKGHIGTEEKIIYKILRLEIPTSKKM